MLDALCAKRLNAQTTIHLLKTASTDQKPTRPTSIARSSAAAPKYDWDCAHDLQRPITARPDWIHLRLNLTTFLNTVGVYGVALEQSRRLLELHSGKSCVVIETLDMVRTL